MTYQDFREAFFIHIGFSSNQVLAWYPGFDKNNLGRWVKKGFLIKLRNGYYTFRDHLKNPNIQMYLANRIYRPSYISLHTALAFHGLIPESIMQTTSVSTLKTARFSNTIGVFSYKSIKEELFFGYQQLPFMEERTILMANPEKAMIDLLYLYPFYNNEKELLDLRIDEDILADTFNPILFNNYIAQVESSALEKRAKLFLKTYNIN